MVIFYNGQHSNDSFINYRLSKLIFLFLQTWPCILSRVGGNGCSNRQNWYLEEKKTSKFWDRPSGKNKNYIWLNINLFNIMIFVNFEHFQTAYLFDFACALTSKFINIIFLYSWLSFFPFPSCLLIGHHCCQVHLVRRRDVKMAHHTVIDLH